MTRPNAMIVVAQVGDRVDGVDVGRVDHPMPTLDRPDVAAWLADNGFTPDQPENWLAVDVEIGESVTYDVSGWPHRLITLAGDELAAVRAVAGAVRTDLKEPMMRATTRAVLDRLVGADVISYRDLSANVCVPGYREVHWEDDRMDTDASGSPVSTVRTATTPINLDTELDVLRGAGWIIDTPPGPMRYRLVGRSSLPAVDRRSIAKPTPDALGAPVEERVVGWLLSGGRAGRVEWTVSDWDVPDNPAPLRYTKNLRAVGSVLESQGWKIDTYTRPGTGGELWWRVAGTPSHPMIPRPRP